MLDLNDEETLRFGYVLEQKGCEQSSTLWRERNAVSTRCQSACNCESMQDRSIWARLLYQIIFRVSDHQDFVESKFIVCLAGSGKHSCQARSSQHSNYKPDLIVKDFTVTLLMFALEKKSVFSYAFKWIVSLKFCADCRQIVRKILSMTIMEYSNCPEIR